MIYLFLANGFEETEALATLDVLRRAGIEVLTVGVGSALITGSHNISVMADITDREITVTDNFEGVILPGGMPGTLNLEKSTVVNYFIDYAVEKNLLLAAICAAPSILGHKGILKGKKAVCYDGFENELLGALSADVPVCRDGNIITAIGAGVALDFGFELVSYLKSTDISKKIKDSMKCIR